MSYCRYTFRNPAERAEIEQQVAVQLQGKEVPCLMLEQGEAGPSEERELPIVARPHAALKPPSPDDAPPSGMLIDRLMR